jgi:hypothetical protein
MNQELQVKTKFCTSCQADREEATGIFRVVNKTRRWICRSCLDRKTVSIYKNFDKDKKR